MSILSRYRRRRAIRQSELVRQLIEAHLWAEALRDYCTKHLEFELTEEQVDALRWVYAAYGKKGDH